MPAHVNLTGSDLHPCKGEAAAADNTVRVAVGGVGTWQKIDRAQLEKTGNPFGAHLFHVQHRLAPTTIGQAISALTWTKININTSVTNEISTASLSTSQISLPAGTYMFEAAGNCSLSYLGKTRLYNVTDSSITLIGDAFGLGILDAANAPMNCTGRFTIAGTKVFEWQIHTYSTSTVGPYGLDSYTSAQSGNLDNVVLNIKIYKIA